MSAADFEAERQRFQAEWRKGQEQAATVDDREASWLVNEASNVPAQVGVPLPSHAVHSYLEYYSTWDTHLHWASLDTHSVSTGRELSQF
jgi:hypothetical protein